MPSPEPTIKTSPKETYDKQLPSTIPEGEFVSDLPLNEITLQLGLVGTAIIAYWLRKSGTAILGLQLEKIAGVVPLECLILTSTILYIGLREIQRTSGARRDQTERTLLDT
jgi:hypothetical protein